MALRLYNTLTRTKEVFEPISAPKVRMYACGPTVYERPHIGNYRAYVFEDLLGRYLGYSGYEVELAMNITDVDDKTIAASNEQGKSLREITAPAEEDFHAGLKALNVLSAHYYPHATEHIDDMVTLIGRLLEKGLAYKADDGSVYYDISKFPEYGRLVRLKPEAMRSGDRASEDEYDKEEARDFALWKAWKPDDGDVSWETALGKGRPGWHVECSAMSMHLLGESFDIHCGGVDNIFPHHENEIAQSEGATGATFVKYWSHCAHLIVEGKKMSKSLGNMVYLEDLIAKGLRPEAIRYVLLATHYRQQLDFTQDKIRDAAAASDRIAEFRKHLSVPPLREKDNPEIEKILTETKNRFVAGLDDDLNLSAGLAALFDMIKEINTLKRSEGLSLKDSDKILDLLKSLDEVLGLNLVENEAIATHEDSVQLGDWTVSFILPEDFHKQARTEILKIVEERIAARDSEEWELADELRRKAEEMGVLLEDMADGVVVKERK